MSIKARTENDAEFPSTFFSFLCAFLEISSSEQLRLSVTLAHGCSFLSPQNRCPEGVVQSAITHSSAAFLTDAADQLPKPLAEL